MLNTFPFIQRTEQVLIELDISAIEEYVIIIIIISLNISVNCIIRKENVQSMNKLNVFIFTLLKISFNYFISKSIYF